MEDKVNISELSKTEQTECKDRDIIERYFVALGWKQSKNGLVGNVVVKSGDWFSGFPETYKELPPILTDFPTFKEHVLEVMEEEDYKFNLVHLVYGGPLFEWIDIDEEPCKKSLREPIENNNIFHAAVIAATRYFEGEK